MQKYTFVFDVFKRTGTGVEGSFEVTASSRDEAENELYDYLNTITQMVDREDVMRWFENIQYVSSKKEG